MNIFNSNYGTGTSLNSDVSSDLTRGKSVMSRVFKHRYTENVDEFTTYITSPTVSDENLDPLEWWRINKTQYPQLSRMARDYLAIPATSVPSEQCFSISKNLITSNRNRLMGKTVRISMCLKSWNKLLNNNLLNNSNK